MITGKKLVSGLIDNLNELALPKMASALQAIYKSERYNQLDHISFLNEILTPDNPPRKVALTVESDETNGDGLISEADFFALLDRAIGAFNTLETRYAPADAA